MTGYQIIRIEPGDKIDANDDNVEVGPLGDDISITGAGPDLVRLAVATLQAARVSYERHVTTHAVATLALINDALDSLSGMS